MQVRMIIIFTNEKCILHSDFLFLIDFPFQC